MSGLSNYATNVARAVEVLRRLGKEPYGFQAQIAADCIKAIEAKEKMLVVAPTGVGKTLNLESHRIAIRPGTRRAVSQGALCGAEQEPSHPAR